jgi:hypothetical protein
VRAYRDRPNDERKAVARSPLWDRYAQLSSEELLDMVLRSPGDYTEEALEVARAVLSERDVDADREASRVDEAAREAHARADEEERAREEATAELAGAARALGVCCACRKASPEVDLHVVAKRPIIEAGTAIAGSRLHTSEAVLLAVPMCRACEPAYRIPPAPGLGWWLLGAAAAIGAEVALVLLVPSEALDPAVASLILAAPLGLAGLAGWLGVRANDEKRNAAALRLARLHPAYATLTRRSGIAEVPFSFLPPEHLGRSRAQVLASLLSDPRPEVRRSAEEQLGRAHGSAVVDALRARLQDPVACVHAVRALGRLRAREAVGDLREVAASGPPDARDEAKAVLGTLE